MPIPDMYKDTSITPFNPYDIFSEVSEPEHLPSPSAQQSYHTTTELSADDIANVDAWKVAFKKREFREKVATSVTQLELVVRSCFTNFEQSTFRDIVKAEVELQGGDRLNDLVAITFGETFMNDINLVTYVVPCQRSRLLKVLLPSRYHKRSRQKK